MLELVGADGEGPSRRLEPVERGFGAGKGAALVGNMRLVTGKKREEHLLEPRRRDAAPGSRDPAFDQGARAGTEHGPRRLERQWRDPLLGEDIIQRADEIARGVDQRAVEIEDEKRGRGIHCAGLCTPDAADKRQRVN